MCESSSSVLITNAWQNINQLAAYDDSNPGRLRSNQRQIESSQLVIWTIDWGRLKVIRRRPPELRSHATACSAGHLIAKTLATCTRKTITGLRQSAISTTHKPCRRFNGLGGTHTDGSRVCASVVCTSAALRVAGSATRLITLEITAVLDLSPIIAARRYRALSSNYPHLFIQQNRKADRDDTSIA